MALTCGGLLACGDSSGDTSSDGTETGDGDGDTGDGDGDTGDGDGDSATGDGDGDSATGDGDGDTNGDGDGDTNGDGDGDTNGDGDGDTGGACMVWAITYDLEGSVFEISGTTLGAGDQVNTVTMPYDADDHVGPGTFVLHFNDEGGAPGGMVYMNSYDMTMDFTVSAFGATVNTDLQNDAGPEECGITSAELNGGTMATWNPLAIVNHHSMGQILCNGNLCGAGGLPNGMPVPVDETTDHPLSTFNFTDDFSAFQSETVVVQQDNNSTTEWTFEGIEASRELVAGPECLCP